MALEVLQYVAWYMVLGMDQSGVCLLCAVQGERALGFVLGNKGMIDKTLLFDIELLRLQR